MTPILDRYLRQWRLYKKSLVAFLAINVFSVCMALVLGFNFFVLKRDIINRQRASLARVAAADQALDKLDVFIGDLKSRARFEIRTHADEAKALGILADWQDIKGLLAQAGAAQDLDHAALIFTTEGYGKLQDVQGRLRKSRAQEIETVRTGLDQYTRQVSLIVLVGLLTLLFGILLPNFVFYLMGRSLNSIRLEVQKSALEFITRWNETREGFGEGAFKNAEFWLQILLLAGQESTRFTSHPAVHLAGELAELIRLELKKKNSGQSAA